MTAARDEYRASHVLDDPGLRREIAAGEDLFGDAHSEAVFSADSLYRYLLIRRWAPGGLTATFVMLNPSTAGAETSDPTVTRCLGFARDWGCSALAIVNLFAYRTPHPRQLRRAGYPVGQHNDRFIEENCLPGRLVVAAWGASGTDTPRAARVTAEFTRRGVDLLCFGTTKNGQPLHPLYLPGECALISYPTPAPESEGDHK